MKKIFSVTFAILLAAGLMSCMPPSYTVPDKDTTTAPFTPETRETSESTAPSEQATTGAPATEPGTSVSPTEPSQSAQTSAPYSDPENGVLHDKGIYTDVASLPNTSIPYGNDWEDRDDEDFEDHLFSGFRRDGSALTPDTRYETSFFVVSLDADGSVTEMDHSYIASVSEEDIDAYAKEILASGKEQGRADYFMYKVFDSDDGTSKIVAVSCYQQLRQFRLLLSICILAGFLYMAAVFALVWLMSRRITKPVEESIQKQRQFITGEHLGRYIKIGGGVKIRYKMLPVYVRKVSRLPFIYDGVKIICNVISERFLFYQPTQTVLDV